MSEHIDDMAALYALGALDDEERARIDRHAIECDACALALGQASEDVASIVLTEPQLEAPADLQARVFAGFSGGAGVPISVKRSHTGWAMRFAAAAAAVLVLSLAPSAYLWEQNLSMHRAMLAESDAMARIAMSPHRIAAFSSADARVMYGPDGSWYCVIVRNANAPVQVAWKHGGQMTMLGTAVPHGDVAMLYLPKSHRMDQLALMQGGAVVGDARLVF